MTYASRNWTAIATPDLVNSTVLLTVTGEVQLTKVGQTATLTKADPQGTSPATLTLTLSVTGGLADLMVWTPVAFVTTITAHQYKHVRIAGDGDATMPVQELLS